MKDTRNKILKCLLKKPRSTVAELAEAVGINSISIRHHLSNFQLEGLVEAQEERHGIGRPRLVYFLTSEGIEKFPTRYLRLTMQLVSQMKENIPETLISKLFNQIAEEIVSGYLTEMKKLGIEGRLNLLKEILSEEGFSLEWKNKEGQYFLYQKTCPYYQISINHPEICNIDQAIISKSLFLPVIKMQCVINGAAHCAYVVQTPSHKTITN